MFRLLCALALTTAGTVALAACDVSFASFGPQETFRDEAALPSGITAVRIDAREGSVAVRGGDAKPSLHRTVRYREDRPDGATHRVEDGVLVLGGCARDCSVGYTVDVPAGVRVTGGSAGGSIHLHRAGEVNVTTGSGAIRLAGVTGPITAKTSRGRIEGHDLKSGRISAETSNGAITLVPSVPADVRARTSNGDITVTVTGGPYRVSAATGNGDERIGVPTAPSAEHRLDLRSGNGDITATAP
ncbi:lipoprotein [Actinomadura cremea]|nr:lipoprotein [Actinomadura cremea]